VRIGGEGLADLLGLKPRGGDADRPRVPVDDLEGAAVDLEQAPDLGQDLLERLAEPVLGRRSVLVVDDRAQILLARHPIGAAARYASRWTVLGGEVAVPCRSQSALARPNPLLRGEACGVSAPRTVLMARVPRDAEP
jgi:hypothetical protein